MATAQIPPGVNLADDLRPNILAGVIVMSVLAGIALTIRLVSTKIVRRKISVSDFLVVIGFLFSWTDSALVIYSVTLGLGLHIERVPLDNVEAFLFSAVFQEIFYTLSLACTKISILFFYRQIFANSFTWASYTIMAMVIGWAIALVLVSIFSCTPVEGFWKPFMQPPPQCINSRAFYIGNAVPNIVMDIMILSLPIRGVMKLQMKTRSKIAVSGLFLLGSFVIIASSVRLANLLNTDVTDATYGFVQIALWSCVEMNSAVISACLPTAKPLLSELVGYLSKIKSYITGSRSRSKSTRMYPNTHEEPKELS